MITREEIERASVHHLYQYDYSYEEGEHLDFYIKGFTEGAKWADNNPNNIWHDAIEEPTDDLAQIIYQDNYGDCWLATKSDIIILSCNWEHFASVNVRRWAYIKDLLPKGGD
jgi:hypothetical protein